MSNVMLTNYNSFISLIYSSSLHNNIQSWNVLKLCFYTSSSAEIKVNGELFVSLALQPSAGYGLLVYEVQ
jgi:hypothetical protein